MEIELYAIIKEPGKEDIKIGITGDFDKKDERERKLIGMTQSILNTLFIKFSPLVTEEQFIKFIRSDKEVSEELSLYPACEKYHLSKVESINIINNT